MTFLAYAFGVVAFAVSKRRPRWISVTRVAWTIACACLIAHFVSAFQFYHGWSHASAYRDTARQTAEVVGLNSGAGLFVNYALLTGWIVDVGWWWLGGLDSYRRRPWPLVVVWHAFLVFIIFNATVVFKDGLVRWLGLAVCAILSLAWISIVRRRSTATQLALDNN